MHASYWMALFNVIAGFITVAGILIYKKAFPKKKINFFALAIILSILPCISIFRPGVYESGDFTQYIYRAMAFTDALKDGILIPSWAAGLNAGYGYPVFIFIYPMPSYLIAFLNFVGFSFVFSEKIILALAFILSGMFMYLLTKKITKNDLASLTASVVYLFTPYHLVDLHFRVATAETLAFVFPPLILYLILKLNEKQAIHVLLLGLLFGLFFLTHPAQFVFYSALFSAFVLYQNLIKRDSITFLLLCVSFLIGLAISSFSWLPRFTLTQFTYGSQLIYTSLSYLKPTELLYAPWRYGLLFQGPGGELSFLIGYTQIALLTFAGYYLLKHRKDLQVFFWVISSFLIIFLMLPYSKPVWDIIPLLKLMQFSYRLLQPLTFCLSIIAAYLCVKYYSKKSLIFLFIFLTVGYTFLNWGHRNLITDLNDTWLRQNLANSTIGGERVYEATPIWQTLKNSSWISKAPIRHLEVINGSAQIKEISRTTIDHNYIVLSSTGATLLDNTDYFPGWTVKADSKTVPIIYSNVNYPARIAFSVPKGLHLIQVHYEDIPILQFSKILSLLTVFLIMTYCVYYWIKSKLLKDYVKPNEKK